MKHLWQRRLTQDMIIRIIADALMVNLALLIALAIRYLWLIRFEDDTAIQISLGSYINAYLSSVWILTLASLIVFFLSGFYTRGRMYRGRYKALIVAQAVSISYVLYGFVSYLFPEKIALPRGALLIAWGLTLLVVIGARLWSMLWAMMLRTESLGAPGEPLGHTPQRVLLIGGAGYIGSALLPKLLDAGYHVRLLDLLLFGTEPIATLLQHPNLEIVQADFRQVDTVVAAVRDIDMVVHLGAIVGDPACALDEELTIEVNLMATRMIAEVAKGSGVERFVFASTCSVYGASDELLDERSALNPVSLYARSKIASEKVLRKMADERFAPVILRFGTIYGFSGRTRFDLVVNLLSAKAVVDQRITVSGGDQWRPFVHVDDAAQAVFHVLEAPAALVRNEIFNVGSDEQNRTIQQVGETIQRLVPTATLVDMGSDSDRRNYRVSFGKIRAVLDFRPRYTIEEGITQVTTALRSGAITDYREAKYSNVKFLNDSGTSHLVRRERGWTQALLYETVLASAAPEAEAEQMLAYRAVGG